VVEEVPGLQQVRVLARSGGVEYVVPERAGGEKQRRELCPSSCRLRATCDAKVTTCPLACVVKVSY